jgi:hypothetical protein
LQGHSSGEAAANGFPGFVIEQSGALQVCGHVDTIDPSAEMNLFASVQSEAGWLPREKPFTSIRGLGAEEHFESGREKIPRGSAFPFEHRN